MKKTITALTSWKKQLAEPMWDGAIPWKTVKSELYRAMMNNDKPRDYAPRELQ